MIAWVLFVAGGIVCALNCYLSWLRYPLHRARGRSRESFRWLTGVPLVGSTLVGGAWVLLRHSEPRWITGAAALLVLADSGGPHWFLVQLLRQRVSRTPTA